MGQCELDCRFVQFDLVEDVLYLLFLAMPDKYPSEAVILDFEQNVCNLLHVALVVIQHSVLASQSLQMAGPRLHSVSVCNI